MGRVKGGRDETRDLTNVRVTRALVAAAKVISAARGLDLAAVLERYAMPALVAESRRVVRELDEQYFAADLGDPGA